MTGSEERAGSNLAFEHRFIDLDLPIAQGWVGDYGQTALVDIDGDGNLDFVIGRMRGPQWGFRSVLYWFEYQPEGPWIRHVLGYDSLSDVGACAIDVDGDGWTDIVCGGVWYRNPGNPRESEFERHVFDLDCANAHDVAAADIDGDGIREIITMRGDDDGLCWYKIPPDPTGPWQRHLIGPGIHGAFAPAGIADIDGDGDLDIVCAGRWLENADGRGTRWISHDNIPFGRVGPFGMCVRCIVVDIDGDGIDELIMCDCDIEASKIAVIRNIDGKGGVWERRDLPQSFAYGSLHSLAVGDFAGNGRLDIVSAEQEELLPGGRTNPRFLLWENLGGGKFREYVILDKALGGHELCVGDVDGDGRPEIVSRAWGVQPWNGAGGKMHVDYLKLSHTGHTR